MASHDTEGTCLAEAAQEVHSGASGLAILRAVPLAQGSENTSQTGLNPEEGLTGPRLCPSWPFVCVMTHVLPGSIALCHKI